jgi:hypothetical protein
LVAQRQNLQQRVEAKFQSGKGQTYQDNQPTDQAAEGSRKWLGSTPFSDGMEFLPTTDVPAPLGEVAGTPREFPKRLRHSGAVNGERAVMWFLEKEPDG